MQWASLITADGCMRNILTSVSNQCDGESSCNYNYSGGYQSFDAECSDTFDVEIGAYCMCFLFFFTSGLLCSHCLIVLLFDKIIGSEIFFLF